MDFGSSAKDRDLKIDTDIALFQENDVSLKMVRLIDKCRVGRDRSDDFQRHLHDVNSSPVPVADLIVIRVVVVQRNIVLLLYLYGLYCTSIYDVQET